MLKAIRRLYHRIIGTTLFTDLDMTRAAEDGDKVAAWINGHQGVDPAWRRRVEAMGGTFMDVKLMQADPEKHPTFYDGDIRGVKFDSDAAQHQEALLRYYGLDEDE